MAILTLPLSPFVSFSVLSVSLETSATLLTSVSLSTPVPLVPYVSFSELFPQLKQHTNMDIEPLLSKPVWQMTGEELLFLS